MSLNRLILLAVLSCGACIGCLDAVGPPPPTPSPAPQPVQPQPQPPSQTDSDFWSALADWVAAGKVPTTDRLILIVKEAKDAGYVTNAARLSEVITNTDSKPIEDSNRASIVAGLQRLRRFMIYDHLCGWKRDDDAVGAFTERLQAIYGAASFSDSKPELRGYWQRLKIGRAHV